MPDLGGLLCVNGVQHAFALTSWISVGSAAYMAVELMCPTCGTVVHRDDVDRPWHWVEGTEG